MEDEYIFTLPVEWIQNQAVELMGRELNEKELYKVSKGIESGLYFDLNTVVKTAFDDLDHGKIQNQN